MVDSKDNYKFDLGVKGFIAFRRNMLRVQKVYLCKVCREVLMPINDIENSANKINYVY